MDEQSGQMPLFIIVTETEVSDGVVAIREWCIWFDGQVELLRVYFIEGG